MCVQCFLHKYVSQYWGEENELCIDGCNSSRAARCHGDVDHPSTPLGALLEFPKVGKTQGQFIGAVTLLVASTYFNPQTIGEFLENIYEK